MDDLEIRGAGNLLGAEQSGHIAAVGFDMYAQMLEEAVHELAGEQAALVAPVRVDLPVTAYSAAGVHRVRGDQDRRAPAHRPGAHGGRARGRARRARRPLRAAAEPVEDLISLQAIRVKAGEVGATSVVYRGSRLQVDGVDLDDDWADRVRRTSNPRATYFKKDRMLAVHRDGAEESLLRWVETTLDAILASRVSDDPSSTPGRESL